VATLENGHAERAHALLGASSAYRWLACTPSARLEDSFKEDEEASVYALEGTLAHELAEVEIAYATDRLGLDERVRRYNEIRANLLYSEELEEEVYKYVDYVLDVWREAKQADEFAELMLEDKIDLSTWVPEGFGSNDVVILYGETLHVIDLKFGKGVRVKADNNPQLKLYGIGALDKHGILFDVSTVRLTIHQPRIGNVSTFELNAFELNAWGQDFVKPRAAIAFKGEGDFAPGEHCRFCKAAVRCRALAEKNLELAKFDFVEPTLLDDLDLVEIFDKADFFVKWINKVTGYVYNEALGGKAWPGFKLVESRSNRVITNEEAVAFKLLGEGFKRDEYLNEKLKGLTDLTKLLGKARFEKLIGPHIVKPQGKPALVAKDDPRPEFSSNEKHKLDFEDEI